MDVIQERLEREYDLDLITTAPSVIYHVTKTDGTALVVDNPLNWPDPAQIEKAEEPYVKASIITPPEYVGNIMDLCQDRRGEYEGMKPWSIIAARRAATTFERRMMFFLTSGLRRSR